MMMPSNAQIPCPKCGAMVPVNRMYCSECGAEIEHDPNLVQAGVDAENRLEKIRNISKTIRWFLAASLVLSIGGCYFRRAYRDLPSNDIVAFAAAPTVPISAESSIETLNFLVVLPEPKAPARVKPPSGNVDAKLIEDALKRTTVLVRKRGQNRGVEALLIGDTVFDVKVPGRDGLVAVHLADVRRIRPLTAKTFEIQARNLKEAAKVTFEKPEKVLLKILERRPDGREAVQTIPIDQINELKPL